MLSRSVLRLVAAPASRRLYSSVPTPPMLSKIRADLKDAMRNKDTNKLNVLRSLLAEVTNASKTSNPPTTDLHILALITKTKAKSADSVAEFRAAGREDLAEKEAGQIAVLDSYASQVETIGEDEIVAVVNSVIDGEVKGMSSVMKEVMKAFEGKPVVKGEVAAIVKKALAKKKTIPQI